MKTTLKITGQVNGNQAIFQALDKLDVKVTKMYNNTVIYVVYKTKKEALKSLKNIINNLEDSFIVCETQTVYFDASKICIN